MSTRKLEIYLESLVVNNNEQDSTIEKMIESFAKWADKKDYDKTNNPYTLNIVDMNNNCSKIIVTGYTYTYVSGGGGGDDGNSL